jgi:hypothetical protein
VPAAARVSGSPDLASSGSPVAKSSGAWVWDKLRYMRNPPRALAGLGEARGRGCDGGRGSTRRSSPACACACCSGHRKGHKRGPHCARARPTGPSATGRGGCRGAHRGLELAGEAAQGGRRRGPSGRSAWSSRRGPMQGVSGLLITTGLLMVFLRGCHGG